MSIHLSIAKADISAVIDIRQYDTAVVQSSNLGPVALTNGNVVGSAGAADIALADVVAGAWPTAASRSVVV